MRPMRVTRHDRWGMPAAMALPVSSSGGPRPHIRVVFEVRNIVVDPRGMVAPASRVRR
jgi:hypothetical protein